MVYYIFQSFVVYLLLFLVMYVLCKETCKTENILYAHMAVAIYAIVFGCRYGVGYDSVVYSDNYELALQGLHVDNYEIGFSTLQNFFLSYSLPSWAFLSVVAFLQLFLVYYGLKDFREIYPFLTITFIFGCVWLTYSNGIRQIIAFSLFSASLLFLRRTNFIGFFLFLITACTFHKSAVVLLVLIPFLTLNKDFFPNKTVQYLGVIGSFVAGKLSVVLQFMFLIDYFCNSMGYEVYMQNRYSHKILSDGFSIGIGYVINVLLILILIFYSDKVKQKFPHFINIYNLFFLGVIFCYMFEGSHLIQRINYYFYGFNYIVGAFTLCTLREDDNNKGYKIILSLYVLVFIGTLYKMFSNNSAFYFFWQKSDYFRYLSF